jgi:hypothetical protein
LHEDKNACEQQEDVRLWLINGGHTGFALTGLISRVKRSMLICLGTAQQ